MLEHTLIWYQCLHMCEGQQVASCTPTYTVPTLNVCAQGHTLFCSKLQKYAPPGGLEPPTFRLTAERASQLRHGG